MALEQVVTDFVSTCYYSLHGLEGYERKIAFDFDTKYGIKTDKMARRRGPEGVMNNALALEEVTKPMKPWMETMRSQLPSAWKATEMLMAMRVLVMADHRLPLSEFATSKWTKIDVENLDSVYHQTVSELVESVKDGYDGNIVDLYLREGVGLKKIKEVTVYFRECLRR